MARPSAAPATNRPLDIYRTACLRLASGVAALVIVGGAAYGGWYSSCRPPARHPST